MYIIEIGLDDIGNIQLSNPEKLTLKDGAWYSQPYNIIFSEPGIYVYNGKEVKYWNNTEDIDLNKQIMFMITKSSMSGITFMLGFQLGLVLEKERNQKWIQLN